LEEPRPKPLDVALWRGDVATILSTVQFNALRDEHSLVLTSRIISAEAWQPVTMCRVHTDRSWVVSARNRWASMPSRVPVLVAKESSAPESGDPPRSGPECTSLVVHITQNQNQLFCLSFY